MALRVGLGDTMQLLPGCPRMVALEKSSCHVSNSTLEMTVLQGPRKGTLVTMHCSPVSEPFRRSVRPRLQKTAAPTYHRKRDLSQGLSGSLLPEFLTHTSRPLKCLL